MKVFKVDITSWTASFKYPNLISAFQPTLEVPPISTILGLINAAAGRYVKHGKLKLGYYFEFEAKGCDVETVYQIEGHEKGYPKHVAKSNVINREFLFNNHLVLYLCDEYIASVFSQPIFPLLLGRSNDLATVNGVEEVDLQEIEKGEKIVGQIVPFGGNCLAGDIQPLPKYFSETIPRNNWGTEIYSVISWQAKDMSTKLKVYSDTLSSGKVVHIYFHELDFSHFYE